MISWRHFAQVAKRSRHASLMAHRLDGGTGRLRWIDRLITRAQPAPHRPDLTSFAHHDLSASWIGHATVLLRTGGMNILTDPAMGVRVGLGLGVLTGGPARHIAPALLPHELPHLDLIAISHAHFDHLDVPTLARLSRKVPVVTAEGTSDLIRGLGFACVREMPWGSRVQFGSLTVHSLPVRHWAGRLYHDHGRQACAYLFECDGRRVFFGGDTAFCDHYKPLRRVDLAVLGIGAYDPWEAGHATPEQAWQMAGHMGAEYVLPMHHSTFRLSHEPMNEPLMRLTDCAGRESGRLVCREIGQVWSLN